MMRRSLITIFVTCLIHPIATLPVSAADNPTKTPDFEKDVFPLFKEKCNRCHGDNRRGGKLDMRTLDAILKGGVSGPAIQPGDAKKSLLIDMVRYDEMPPPKAQPRVTAEELNMLRRWVDALKPKESGH